VARLPIKKVALVTPPYHSGVVETAGAWPNVAFVYFAGALRAEGFEPWLYDAMTANHTLEEIGENLLAFAPDMVVTSCYTPSYPKGAELLAYVKQLMPDVVTGIGGVHANFMYREVLADNPAIDYVFRGEGDVTLTEMVKAYNAAVEAGLDGADFDAALTEVQGIAFRGADGEVIATQRRPMLADLDNRPMAWDLVDWDLYQFYPIPDTNLAVVSSSRGCDQQCAFCSQQKFWGRSWRARSAKDFVDELELLNREYGVGVVMLSDETPTLDRARWETILDDLIERDLGMYLLMETRVDDILRDEDILWKYAKAGVHHVYVGVERTDQATLDMFKKNTEVAMGKKALDLLNSHNIITETSLVLGLPSDTPEIIEETFRLAQHYNPDLAFFLTIAPWPYADMYADLQPYIVTYDYENYNLVAPVVKPQSMTVDELMETVISCYKRFYMGKLKEVPTMSPFKRRYYLVTMKLLMSNSYLTKFMGGMGEMPETVKELLDEYLTEEEQLAALPSRQNG